MTNHYCEWPCCGRSTASFMCEPHWNRMPSTIRRAWGESRSKEERDREEERLRGYARAMQDSDDIANAQPIQTYHLNFPE